MPALVCHVTCTGCERPVVWEENPRGLKRYLVNLFIYVTTGFLLPSVSVYARGSHLGVVLGQDEFVRSAGASTAASKP
jgi:hypothetical protein